MPTEPRRDRTGRSLLTRFLRARDGATAVEFGFVAWPFLFAVLATMEVAMMLWTGEVLEKAVATASRKIYTGEFQSDTTNAGKTNAQLQTKFRDSVCTDVAPLIACDDVKIDIRGVSSFANATPPNPIKADKTFDTSAFSYSAVGAKQIGLVTAAVEYKTYFPPLAGTRLKNGNRALIATSAFRTEPYSN